jgi:hypothetical protein
MYSTQYSRLCSDIVFVDQRHRVAHVDIEHDARIAKLGLTRILGETSHPI